MHKAQVFGIAIFLTTLVFLTPVGDVIGVDEALGMSLCSLKYENGKPIWVWRCQYCGTVIKVQSSYSASCSKARIKHLQSCNLAWGNTRKARVDTGEKVGTKHIVDYSNVKRYAYVGGKADGGKTYGYDVYDPETGGSYLVSGTLPDGVMEVGKVSYPNIDETAGKWGWDYSSVADARAKAKGFSSYADWVEHNREKHYGSEAEDEVINPVDDDDKEYDLDSYVLTIDSNMESIPIKIGNVIYHTPVEVLFDAGEVVSIEVLEANGYIGFADCEGVTALYRQVTVNEDTTLTILYDEEQAQNEGYSLSTLGEELQSYFSWNSMFFMKSTLGQLLGILGIAVSIALMTWPYWRRED